MPTGGTLDKKVKIGVKIVVSKKSTTNSGNIFVLRSLAREKIV